MLFLFLFEAYRLRFFVLCVKSGNFMIFALIFLCCFSSPINTLNIIFEMFAGFRCI